MLLKVSTAFQVKILPPSQKKNENSCFNTSKISCFSIIHEQLTTMKEMWHRYIEGFDVEESSKEPHFQSVGRRNLRAATNKNK